MSNGTTGARGNTTPSPGDRFATFSDDELGSMTMSVAISELTWTPDVVQVVCDRGHPNADCNEWDWYIVFRNRDEFVWVRDDWVNERGEFTGATIPRYRCAPSIA